MEKNRVNKKTKKPKKKQKDESKENSKEGPKEKKLTRTISIWNSSNHNHNQILRFMAWESKNIYNTSIFHMQVYFSCSDKIFESIYKLVRKKLITDIADFDKKVYELYDEFYKRFVYLKPFKQYNNNIIYNYIKKFINDINLVNGNYFVIEKIIIFGLEKSNSLRFPKNIDIDTKKELFDDIVSSILKSIYNKNFNQTKEEILCKKKCTIDNQIFIEHIKNNNHLFKNDKPKNTFKKLLKNHRVFINLEEKKGIKSDKNYISRIIYNYYTNPKIPSDLMCNIIVKAHQAYTSFFALRKKGIKANIPKFLPKNGAYILPYYARSRKEVIINGKQYYRLTVGQYISDNFIDVIDDNRYACIGNGKIYKLYVNKKYLRFVPKNKKLSEKNNYIYENKYISKKSSHIIEGYYIYIRKPKPINNMKLKLIEISPQYNGYRFKINFVYEAVTTNNKPTKGKVVSIDFGMVNLMTIHDPDEEQIIIKGNYIIGLNHFYNDKIDQAKSLLSTNKPSKKNAMKLFLNKHNAEFDYVNKKNNKYIPKRKTKNDEDQKKRNQEWDYILSNGNIKMPNGKQLTSKKIRNLLIRRTNKINNYFETSDHNKRCLL